MQKKDSITVNNIMLYEYLKSHETLKQEKERKRIINDGNDVVVLRKNIKPKYPQYKEKNGEVKILSQREKNKAMYEQNLKKALRNDDRKMAVFTILLSHPKKTVFTAKEFEELIDSFASKNNIIAPENMSFSSRAILNSALHKKLSKYITITDRTRDSGGNLQPSKYSIKDEYLDTLTLQEVIKLNKIRLDDEIKKPVNKVKKKRTDKPMQEVVKVEPKNIEPQEIKTEKTTLEGLEGFLKGQGIVLINATFNIHIQRE